MTGLSGFTRGSGRCHRPCLFLRWPAVLGRCLGESPW
jgi:hypothetical protein